MLSIAIADILKLTDGVFYNVPKSSLNIRHIKGISIDSRSIEPGEIFWCIRGNRFDGHEYVGEALAKGALFAVVEKEYSARLPLEGKAVYMVPDTLKALQELSHNQRMKYNIPVLAITGSNGKTTTKEMIAHILQTKMNIHKTKGNLNNQIGCPLTMLHLTELHEAAIMELGSNHFGEIDVLARLVAPSHALITLIADTHLEYLGDRAGVAKEKLSLFDSLAEGSVAYINTDDPYISTYDRSGLKYVRFGMDSDADYKGAYGKMNKKGCGALILKDTEIRLQVPGIHNVRNALAAATVALDLGMTLSDVALALESFRGYEKRMQVLEWNGVTILNDTYNANPASMKLAIETLTKIDHKGRAVMAVGDMNELGENEIQMHVDVLNFALEKAVVKIFIVGQKMQQAAKDQKTRDLGKFVFCDTVASLSDCLTKYLKPGDVLLLKASRSLQMEKVLAYLP